MLIDTYCVCSKCNKKLVRNASPTTYRKSRCVDLRLRVWNGRCCPDCNATIQREKRVHSKFAPVDCVIRLCRECQKVLPQSLYFYHVECRGEDWSNSYEDVGIAC